MIDLTADDTLSTLSTHNSTSLKVVNNERGWSGYYFIKVPQYLSPIPTCFFIVRSSIVHLNIPIVVALIIGVVVELVGLSSIYVCIWYIKYSQHKRKMNEKFPVCFSFISIIFYFTSVILLTTVLELYPSLSKFSTVVFPTLSLVVELYLVLISFQNKRKTPSLCDDHFPFSDQ